MPGIPSSAKPPAIAGMANANATPNTNGGPTSRAGRNRTGAMADSGAAGTPGTANIDTTRVTSETAIGRERATFYAANGSTWATGSSTTNATGRTRV